MKILLILLFGFTAHNSSAYAQTTQALTVNLQKTTNFNQAQYDHLLEATKLVTAVVNSAEFKDAVLNFSYLGKKEFVQNEGMTNEQIYNYLMTGAEKYPRQTAEDHMMDFNLTLYTSNWFGRKTLGYTDITTSEIHMNTRFYNDASTSEIAMNLVHEWTHKMGFDHDFNSTARRPSSVPYAIGYLVRDLGKKVSSLTSAATTVSTTVSSSASVMP